MGVNTRMFKSHLRIRGAMSLRQRHEKARDWEYYAGAATDLSFERRKEWSSLGNPANRVTRSVRLNASTIVKRGTKRNK